MSDVGAVIDPQAVVTGVGSVLAAVWAIEMGIAFLLRSVKETVGGSDDE